MTTDADRTEYGTAEEIDGRVVLRFERHLAHPRDKVWDALTRPERLAAWFAGNEIELDLVEGGAFAVRTTGPPELVDAIVAEAGEEALVQHNTVLTVEPPSVFEHTFGAPDSVVRWELEPEGDGCRLRLLHTEPVGFAASEHGSRDLAGWHQLLGSLERVLDGVPAPWQRERWEELRDEYNARIS